LSKGVKIVVDWLVKLFQDPTVSSLLTAVAVEGGKAIYQKLLRAEQNTPEWQLFDSLDRAFFQTETDLSRKHDTEAIRETFFSELFDFSSAFSIDTLKQVFQDALGRPATDHELNVWVSNVVKQIALPEHEVLFRYLQTLHILPNELTQQPQKPSPILTPGASVWDDKNILARDEFINSLCADFTEHPRRIQLVGMGGIGKTEILNKLYAKLASKHSECGFDFVGLVHFSGSIESDIAQQIEYPAQYHGLQGEKAALSYLHDLCMEHRVLLLVDDIRAQQPLPKAKDNPLQYLTTLGASVLLASRVPFPQFEGRKVDVLPTEECIKIFERQYGRAVNGEEERKLLTKIILDKAGQNTLIVNRLGGMAKDPGWAIKELFDHLETQQFSIPKGAADDETLQLEIKKLYILDKDFTPAEISILEAFSIFPAIPLTLDLCKEWLSLDAGVEPDDCARILTKLTQKTWLVRHEAENSYISLYSMHQVVREAVKGQLVIEGSTHVGLIDACTEALNQSTNNYIFAVAAQIIPFATTVFEEIKEENEPVAFLSDAIGNYYYKTASYTLAMHWRKKAATLAEKVFGVEHENTAGAYNNIACICESQGNYPNALEWHLKALEVKEKVLGKKHPSTATTYNNIAGVYDTQGDYSKALEWYLKALFIREKVLGKEHPSAATTYNNIATVYFNLGDYPKALEWYSKALDILEKVLGKDHPYTATTYNNIALVYKKQGDYPKALEWYFKALNIREKVLGKEHPDTATTYNNIAVVYCKQEDYPKALEWYLKALEIIEKVLGKEHPDTAITYNNIALVFKKQGDYSLALEWYFKDLAISEKVLGKEHPDTATTYNNIAGVYDSQGNYPNALEWYFKSLRILEKILGIEHPSTATTYNNIAGVYYEQGDYKAALEWLQKALLIFEAKLGHEHPKTKYVREATKTVTAKLASSDPAK
jgi:tetratricopeptide (TPR) repeat protein